MLLRRSLIIAITVLLASIVIAGLLQTLPSALGNPSESVILASVHDYVAPSSPADSYYAVHNGALFQGGPAVWYPVPTPEDATISSVAVDGQHDATLYIGVANELALYRSADGGRNWQKTMLGDGLYSGLTDIAVDGFQKLVYAITDTGSVYRLRDNGQTLTVGSHLVLDEPVIEVAASSTGDGLAILRTDQHLYQAINYGTAWKRLDTLGATPSALHLSQTDHTTIYVGTEEQGLLKSRDGITWTQVPLQAAKEGDNAAHIRLDALIGDPALPHLVYAITSHVQKTDAAENTSRSIISFNQNDNSWRTLVADMGEPIAALLPVSGEPDAVLAMTTKSKQPIPIGTSSILVEEPSQAESQSANAKPLDAMQVIAWAIAGLALLSFSIAIAFDLRQRRRRTAFSTPQLAPVRSQRR